jgi:hypothetical protein
LFFSMYWGKDVTCSQTSMTDYIPEFFRWLHEVTYLFQCVWQCLVNEFEMFMIPSIFLKMFQHAYHFFYWNLHKYISCVTLSCHPFSLKEYILVDIDGLPWFPTRNSFGPFFLNIEAAWNQARVCSINTQWS